MYRIRLMFRRQSFVYSKQNDQMRINQIQLQSHRMRQHRMRRHRMQNLNYRKRKYENFSLKTKSLKSILNDTSKIIFKFISINKFMIIIYDF